MRKPTGFLNATIAMMIFAASGCVGPGDDDGMNGHECTIVANGGAWPNLWVQVQHMDARVCPRPENTYSSYAAYVNVSTAQVASGEFLFLDIYSYVRWDDPKSSSYDQFFPLTPEVHQVEAVAHYISDPAPHGDLAQLAFNSYIGAAWGQDHIPTYQGAR